MADDYSAIADPVQAASDDYSSIAIPLEHVEKTQDFSAIATPLPEKTSGDIAMGGLKSLAEGAAVGGGGVLKGLAVSSATDATHEGMFNDTGMPNVLSRTGMEKPYKKTAQQKLEDVKNDPAYKLGSFIQDSAKEAY